MTRLDRLMRRVVARPDGCWEYDGRHDKGYARASRGAHGEGNANVVKMLYEDAVGPVPDGLVLDHFVCQRTWCVNWRHVEPVTNAENIRRGRRTKLTMDQAEQIREEIKMGEKQKDIAVRYGVSPSLVSRIGSKQRWVL